MITLGVYLFGGCPDRADLRPQRRAGSTGSDVTRFIAGMGIGGEYAAINSAIDELIPAQLPGPGRHRRQRHLLGRRPPRHRRSPCSSSTTCPRRYSWRVAFLARPGPRLRHPLRPQEPAREPPLAAHARPGRGGRGGRRPRSSAHTEARGGTLGEVDESKAIEITPGHQHRLHRPGPHAVRHLPEAGRSSGASLMITQSFLYNAIFFTYALVLTKIYGVAEQLDRRTTSCSSRRATCSARCSSATCSTPSAARKMIAGTYLLSGVAAGHQRRPVQGRRAQRRHPDDLLVRDLLLRLRRAPAPPT